jgi:hypothetical protein
MTTQFVMRAFKTTVPTGHVYWAVLNTPDYTGAESGYNPADLTNIVVDYSFEVPINGSGGAIPPGLAGGDLTGTYPDPSVAKIAGTPVSTTTPTNGQVLTYVSADGKWEPQPSVAGGGPAGGDLSGTYPDPTVSKIHAATVPAAGSLTPGNVLQVSGASALSYGPVNLAGGPAFVSGQLPTGNQVPQTVGGDLSGTTASATVAKLDGYVLSAPNPQIGQFLEFNGSTWSPTTISSSFPPSGAAGGDLGGTYPNPNVVKLQGRPVASTTPQNGYVLTWNTTNSDWEPTRTFAFEVQPNPSWSQTIWYIDPQSTFGGNDANDGLTASTPVKTWAQVILRFGTYSPLLNQNTTFIFLSNHTDNSDPVIFTPYLGGNGINVVITGVLNSSNQVSTGAFSGLIAKNRNTGTLLTTTLTNAPVSGWFVHDTTNDGYCWVYKNPSSNVAVLSQPMESSVSAIGIGNAFPSEINNTDGYDIYIAYEPVHVNITQITTQSSASEESYTAGRVIIQNLVIFDPGSDDNDSVILGNYVALVETRIDRYSVIYQTELSSELPILNCFIGNAVISATALLQGGILGRAYDAVAVEITQGFYPQLDADIILAYDLVALCNLYVGYYYIEQGANLFAYPTSKIECIDSYVDGYGAVWGPGNINVESIYRYNNPIDNTAVGYFKNTGGITINSKSTAYSFDPSGNGIWRNRIPITPAQLDASLSSGGFAGTASIPGGGIITAFGNDAHGYNYAPNDALMVSNWCIDPQFGNDSNDGKTSLTPIRTWAELVRRWGTSSPVFNVPVIITFLSDQLTNTDPVYLNPAFGVNGSLTLIGTLQHQFNVNLTGVIPKNPSATGPNPAGLLQANLTTAADGYAGYLLINNTQGGAVCWIDSISSGMAVLTNPYVPNYPTYNALPNQVNTFTNGDAISIYQPTKIYVSGFTQGIGAGTILFVHLWLVDPTGTVGNTEVALPLSSSCTETRLDVYAFFNFVTTEAPVNALVNSWCNGGVIISGGSMIGGAAGTALVTAVSINGFIDGDAIIHGAASFGDVQGQGFFTNQIGSVYIDNSSLAIPDNTTYIIGDLLLDSDAGTNYTYGIYGQYKLNLNEVSCRLTYINPSSATSWFKGTPTLLMDGLPFANAYDRTQDPGVWHPARALTPANLDLPVIQGGFGGLAIGDGGSIISDGYQTSSIIVPSLSFFVDPSNVSGLASDGYDGLTSSTPILTIAELNRRYRGRTVTTINTVTFMSDVLSDDDLLDLSTVSLGTGGAINYVGTPHITHTGTLTSGTVPINPAINQRQVIEDTGLGVNGWTGYDGYYISSISDSYDAWIVKVDGTVSADKAFTTRPYNLSTNEIGMFSSGSSYQIAIGSNMMIGNISPTVLTPPQSFGNQGVTFKDFNFIPTGGIPLIIDNTGIVFTRCKFSDPFATAYGNDSTTLYNCNLGNSPVGPPSTYLSTQGIQSTSIGGIGMFAGLYNSYGSDFCQFLLLGLDVYVTGWGLLIDPFAISSLTITGYNSVGVFSGVQIHDTISPTAAILCNKTIIFGDSTISPAAPYNAGFIWGTGNDGYGMVISSGVTVTLDSTIIPILTGALGDFAFDNKGGLITTGRAWNELTGTWTSPINTNWANFILSIGSSGFGYNAHNVANNTALVAI